MTLKTMMHRAGLLAVIMMLFSAVPTLAHDSWVQTNTNLLQVGQVVHVDLMLGNHGNQHRDFKLAGKVDPAFATLEVIEPDGERVNLKRALVDLGSESNPGYWSARYQPNKAGTHLVAHTYDRVVHYAPLRSIKSAKTVFIAAKTPGQLPDDLAGFDRVLDHSLELVPQRNPAALPGAEPFQVQLLFHGEPLPEAHVVCIPRGHTLAPGFDADHERHTDNQGVASFTFEQSNYYLIMAHHEDATASGEGYEATKYSAALLIYLP